MPSTQPTISSTDRIRDLSTINADVPFLLSSASAALFALTGSPLSQDKNDADDAEPPQSLDAAKAIFTANAKTYFTTLQSVMARLRRQAYALEEAGIIAPQAPILAAVSSSALVDRNTRAGQGQGQRPGEKMRVKEEERLVNGGLGGLDVAWLNSRVGEGGLEKEAEVLEEAKALVQEALGKASEPEDVEMENVQ